MGCGGAHSRGQSSSGEASPSLAPVPLLRATPAAPGSSFLSSAPLGWCAQHTFSKSSWFLLMKSCLSSTQCESCLTKNIAQSAFQSARKKYVSLHQSAGAMLFPPVCLHRVTGSSQRGPPLPATFSKTLGRKLPGKKLALFPLSLTASIFPCLNNPGPAFWGLRSDHTGKK